MATESFNEETQRDKVAAGFRGGSFFQNPILHPAMRFEEGLPAEVKEKMDFASPETIPVIDTWPARRGK